MAYTNQRKTAILSRIANKCLHPTKLQPLAHRLHQYRRTAVPEDAEAQQAVSISGKVARKKTMWNKKKNLKNRRFELCYQQ